jgi:hypothetical protein
VICISDIIPADVGQLRCASVKWGGHLNAFGVFRAVGDWSPTALTRNTSHFTDVR